MQKEPNLADPLDPLEDQGRGAGGRQDWAEEEGAPAGAGRRKHLFHWLGGASTCAQPSGSSAKSARCARPGRGGGLQRRWPLPSFRPSGKMPFGMWGKNKNTSKETARLVDSEGDSGGAGGCSPEPARQLVFHVQLAHGSATGRVQGFTSNLELYQQIAGVFGLGVSEVRRSLGGFPTPARSRGLLLG